MNIKSLTTCLCIIVGMPVFAQKTMTGNTSKGKMTNGNDNSKTLNDNRKNDQRRYDNRTQNAEVIINGPNNSTAPLIEHKHYGNDPVTPDTVNIFYKKNSDGSIEVYPLTGEWPETIFMYPTAIDDKPDTSDPFNHPVPSYLNYTTYGDGVSSGRQNKMELLELKGKRVDASYIKLGSTSKYNPITLTTTLFERKPEFIIIGNLHNQNQLYIYEDNKFRWLPVKK